MSIEPEAQYWDVIVVGSGMGGATLGYALAKQGLRVLFCEQGGLHLGNRGPIRGDYAEMFFRRMAKAGVGHEEVLRSAGRRWCWRERRRGFPEIWAGSRTAAFWGRAASF